MKTYCAVIILSLLFISTASSQISVSFGHDTTMIWDKNVQRGCNNRIFKITSTVSQDTLYVVERDSIPLTTCGVCYFNFCTSFIGLNPGTYHATVLHHFAITTIKDTIINVGTITFTISTPPSVPPNTTYYQSGCNSTPQSVTEQSPIPHAYLMLSNYPNPFNPSTTIRYSVPRTGHVSLSIFNVSGQQVALLANEVKPAGIYEFNFAADNLSSGVYVCQLNCNGEILSNKLSILR